MSQGLKNEQIANLHHIRPCPLTPNSDILIIPEREQLFSLFCENYVKGSKTLKMKLLQETIYYFKDSMNIVYALNNSDVITMLLKEACSDDLDISTLSIQCCEHIAREHRGKLDIIKKDGIEAFIKLTTHKDATMRLRTYTCLLSLSEDEDCLDELDKRQVFSLVLKKLLNETEFPHLIVINKILGNFLLKPEVTTRFLENKAEDTLINNCFKDCMDLTSISIKNLLYVSYITQGKLRLMKKDIHKTVLKVYNQCDKDHYLFISLFASLAQLTKVKQYYVSEGLSDRCVRLIENNKSDTEIVLNCLLLLTSLAEFKGQREYLKKHENLITSLYSIDNEGILKEYIEDLIETINWKP